MATHFVRVLEDRNKPPPTGLAGLKAEFAVTVQRLRGISISNRVPRVAQPTKLTEEEKDLVARTHPLLQRHPGFDPIHVVNRHAEWYKAILAKVQVYAESRKQRESPNNSAKADEGKVSTSQRVSGTHRGVDSNE